MTVLVRVLGPFNKSSEVGLSFVSSMFVAAQPLGKCFCCILPIVWRRSLDGFMCCLFIAVL